ncbi:MAG: tetratricopeptide repeat protein [Bacteroidota bacterium]
MPDTNTTSEETEEEPEATQSELGRQIVLIVGAGILLVIMLYVITIVSGSFNPTVTGSNAGGGVVGTTPPDASINSRPPSVFGELTPALAEQVSALEDEIDATSGDDQTQLKRELVNLLIGSGRPDLAANVQEEIAQATSDTRDWERAGMLLFEWMDALPDIPVKAAVSQRTVAALDRVLDAEPDNHDVRATLGWAALHDPTAPMRGITETNAVLAEDPNHVRANFNRGQMLLQIGRVEQALEQFEKVLTIVEPTSATHQQVSALVRQLRNTEGTP